MLNPLINLLVIIVLGVCLFEILNYLISIPGNKKLDRKFSKKEDQIAKSIKKARNVLIIFLIILVIINNLRG